MLIKRMDEYRNDRSRLIIYFEDKSYITVNALKASQLNLKPGMEIDEDLFPELSEESRRSAARTMAARIVGRRNMSCHELREKLHDRGVASEDAEYAISWLCEMGFLDDRKYAGILLRHYRAKGFGNRRIQEEMRRRGIAKTDMDAVLEEPVDMQQEIMDFIKKRSRGKELDQNLTSKITSALIRRGHSFEEIRASFRALEIEMEED